MSDQMLILVALAGIFLLLFLVIKTKLHAFVALLNSTAFVLVVPISTPIMNSDIFVPPK